jgi:hypothetical protein
MSLGFAFLMKIGVVLGASLLAALVVSIVSALSSASRKLAERGHETPKANGACHECA